MSRLPTTEEAEAISEILANTRATANEVAWMPGDLQRAINLVTSIHGFKPTMSSGCLTCHYQLLDDLKEIINLPRGFPTQEIPKSRQETRLSICASCLAYREKTESCGRLILDAIKPQPIFIDGEEVTPCGCYLPMKVKVKHATCPARRWPIP